jgi:excinuclease ABC subunit C
MTYAQEKLNLFPIDPGVYLMKDRAGKILYVGKAKNLRVRVRQYFRVGADSREMIPFLIEKIADIETIVTTSEKEALLLENTLIKTHRPKYNALLKDDKTYAALKINHKHPWPRLQIVRYKGTPEPDGLYFGPYTSAYAAREVYELLNKIFRLRQCTDKELARRTRPCILYDMGRCMAPCVGLCTSDEYRSHVDNVIRFLRGQDKEIVKALTVEMEHASEKLEFEKAGALLRTIRQIEGLLQGQVVHKVIGGNLDVVGLYRQSYQVSLAVLTVREGKLTGSRSFMFQSIAEDDTDLLESFLLQHYATTTDPIAEILLPFELSAAIKELMKITLTVPQRGEKKALIDMAHKNAEAYFKKETDAQAVLDNALIEMKETFSLNRYPERIECFDTSNISGTNPVATMIAFTDGKKDTKRYRKYKIRTTEETPNDYAAMQEVLERRFRRGKEEGDLPDLLIVDGGKGHLNVAKHVLDELDVVTVDLIGLAKEEGRHDKGMTREQVFLLNVKDPILLKKNSPILFLLQNIRDEAHRTAIAYHRSLRSKSTLKSALSDIPGIGEVKRKLLLKHFGSLKRVLEATPEQLAAVKGINKRDVEAICRDRDNRDRDNRDKGQ